MKKKETGKNTPATKKDLELLEKTLRKESELMGGSLAFQIEESRQENTERFNKIGDELQGMKGEFKEMKGDFKEMKGEFKEIKKSVDLNTEAMSMLTQELREIKNIEFQVYNHENRITKLENTR